MQSVTIDHINLSAKNAEETALWYDRVFGFKKVEEGRKRDGNPYIIVRNGNQMLCIGEAPTRQEPTTDDNSHRIFHFGLRLGDRQKWEETVRKENLALGYGGPVRYPHSTSWYVTDPNGHEIEASIWDNHEIKFS